MNTKYDDDLIKRINNLKIYMEKFVEETNFLETKSIIVRKSVEDLIVSIRRLENSLK